MHKETSQRKQRNKTVFSSLQAVARRGRSSCPCAEFCPPVSLLPTSPLLKPPTPETLCQATAILGLNPVAGSRRETGLLGLVSKPGYQLVEASSALACA